ncbi:MAG: hypothetical protein H6718_26565 [Polyangiaceae bacterium]|nr:hypothetical protein [Myxococcales bacterium]MCB9589004.1 hypothetical protein [Polyangiaceae bacterium]
MKSAKVSRREAAQALGLGAAASVALVSGMGNAAPASPTVVSAGASTVNPEDTSEGVSSTAHMGFQLVAPLTAGSQLGRWKVAGVLPLREGAVSVVMAHGNDERFQLDVVARGDQRAPGESEFFQVMVVNRGDGATTTREEEGLAAMALADVIRANEHAVDRSGFLTLEQRAKRARQHLHEVNES